MPDLAAQRVLLTTGHQRAIASGDIDGDGKLDLAVPNRATATSVSLFFGVGHANFGPRVDLPTGAGAYAVALADVSGDGAPDVVVANEDDNSVTILFQSAVNRGSFSTTRTLLVGQAPAGLAVADIDGDGFRDIVTANSSSGTGGDVSILLQNPVQPGMFKTAFNVPAGAGACAVAIADLDADGAPDLVVVNERDSTISLIFQSKTTRGTFGAPVTLATGTHPVWLAIGDLAQHNRLDIAVANRDADTVSVFLQGTTPGTFPAPPLTIGVGTQPYWVTAGDVDGDGATDLVVANYGSSSIQVFRQGPSGSFSAGATVAVSSPSSVVVGNFDGDGHADLAVASFTGEITIAVGAATPAGTFRAPASYATSPGCVRHVKCADVNGDGWPDLIAANQNANTISVLLQDPGQPGTFLSAANYSTGSTTNLLDVGDVNGDGRPDIAVGTNGGVVIFRNDAASPGQFLAGVTYAAGSSPCQVVIRDFDGDGKPDLAVSNSGNNTISILIQDPAMPGTFLTAKNYTAGPAGQQAYFLDAGDVDGDGRPDIAVGFLFNVPNSVTVLINSHSQPGTFPTFATLTMGDGCTCVVVRDLDGDGTADIVAANGYQLAVSVFRGNGDGTFGLRVAYPTGDSPSMVSVADLDGDGKLDLCAVNFGVPLTLQVLVQDPTTPLKFLPGPQFRTNPKPSTCDIFDLRKTGKPDIVSTDFNTGSVTVLLSR